MDNPCEKKGKNYIRIMDYWSSRTRYIWESLSIDDRNFSQKHESKKTCCWTKKNMCKNCWYIIHIYFVIEYPDHPASNWSCLHHVNSPPPHPSYSIVTRVSLLNSCVYLTRTHTIFAFMNIFISLLLVRHAYYGRFLI